MSIHCTRASFRVKPRFHTVISSQSYDNKTICNHCHALCKQTAAFIINAVVRRLKEAQLPHTLIKPRGHYKSRKMVWQKFCWGRKQVHGELRQRKRAHRVLISATWSTHEVLKVQRLRTPAILCIRDVAAASLLPNDSSTPRVHWTRLCDFWRTSSFLKISWMFEENGRQSLAPGSAGFSHTQHIVHAEETRWRQPGPKITELV